MFRVVKIKPILMFFVLLLISILLSVGIVSVVNREVVPKPTYTIVVDAGHGGFDVK